MAQQNGDRLGEVGSRIVAEVLIGLIRKSPHSYLTIDGFSPKIYKSARGVRIGRPVQVGWCSEMNLDNNRSIKRRVNHGD
jgi:hypothetical protein